MIRVQTILFLLILFFVKTILAQDTTRLTQAPAIPVSWTHLDTARKTFTSAGSNNNFRAALNSHMLPAYNNLSLKAKSDSIDSTCSSCPLIHRYGYGIRNTLDIKASAQYYNPNIAGGKLWIMRVTSPTATGFQFYFSKFMIPINAALFIYTADRKQILGPYNSNFTPDDSTKAIHFGTVPIMSNDVYLEYFESDSSDYTGNLKIDNIIHMYGTASNPFTPEDNFNTSNAACQEDVCTLTDYVDPAKSVALIVMYDNSSNFTGTCTGTLLNNTKNDGTPYFLTAAHCLGLSGTSGPYDLSTWQFIFDWQYSSCTSGSSTPPTYNTIVWGATALSVDNLCSDNKPVHSDYALLKLTNGTTPVCSLDVVYSGWIHYDVLSPPYPSTSTTLEEETFGTSTPLTMIHHPNGDVKKISRGNNLRSAVDVGAAYDCNDINTFLTGDNFFNFDINPNVSPGYGGGSEPGSSGAPLFVGPESYGIGVRLIGQNFGRVVNPGKTWDSCDPSTYTGYVGKFSTSWTLGNFKQWLDPLNKTSSHFYTGTDPYLPPNYVNTSTTRPETQFFEDGIKINGKSGLPGDGIAVICPTSNMLSITPLIGYGFDMYVYENRVSTSDPNYCPELSKDVNVFGVTVSSKHWYDFINYQVYIDLFDDNFNVVQSVTKGFNRAACADQILYGDGVNWIGMNCFSCIGYGGVPEQAQDGITDDPASKININTGDLGINLIPGRYYNIGIATNHPGSNPVWDYASRYVYILPTDLSINNSSTTALAGNVYASNTITLDNVSVAPNLNTRVEATTYIDMKSTSNFQSGHYFIEKIDCNSFRMASADGENSQAPNMSPSKNNPVKPSNISASSNQISTINGSKNQASISAYPNPTSSITTFDLSNSLQVVNIITYKVYNTTGQLVQSQSVPTNSEKQFNVDLSNLNPGIYNVIITQGNKIWQKKIVKQ